MWRRLSGRLNGAHQAPQTRPSSRSLLAASSGRRLPNASWKSKEFLNLLFRQQSLVLVDRGSSGSHGLNQHFREKRRRAGGWRRRAGHRSAREISALPGGIQSPKKKAMLRIGRRGDTSPLNRCAATCPLLMTTDSKRCSGPSRQSVRRLGQVARYVTRDQFAVLASAQCRQGWRLGRSTVNSSFDYGVPGSPSSRSRGSGMAIMQLLQDASRGSIRQTWKHVTANSEEPSRPPAMGPFSDPTLPVDGWHAAASGSAGKEVDRLIRARPQAASRTSTVICLPRTARAAWIFSALVACSGSSMRRTTRSCSPRRRANSELLTR